MMRRVVLLALMSSRSAQCWVMAAGGLRQGGGEGGEARVLHLSVAEAEAFKQQRKDPEIQTKFLKMKTYPYNVKHTNRAQLGLLMH